MQFAWLFLYRHANYYFKYSYFRTMPSVFIILNCNQMPWVIIPGL